MKSGSFIIYILTILSVIFNLIIINITLNPSKMNFLVKLGVVKELSNHNFGILAMFVLIFSIITCILLLISFILIIRRLLFGYNKNLN